MSNLISNNPLAPLATIVLCWLLIAPLSAQSPGTEHRPSKSLQRELKQRGTIYWTDSPLRDGFQSLAASRRIPIWIDRRCDPSQPVNLNSQSSLADSLWQLSQANDQIDASWSDQVIYVGPPEQANRWATLNHLHRQQMGRLSANARRKWKNAKAWTWPRLTNPQALLKSLEHELGGSIKNSQAIEHDLWPAASYPRLPLFARLELLAAGFGYTFTIQNDGQAALIPMPRAPKFTQKIDVPADHQQAVRRLIESDTTAKWSSDDSRLQASWRTHEAIARILRSPPIDTSSPSLEKIRITLRATSRPLEPLLGQIAKQLDLKIQLSDAAKAKATTRVSFEVEQVTVDELFTAILAPVELQHVRRGTEIRVTSKTEEP